MFKRILSAAALAAGTLGSAHAGNVSLTGSQVFNFAGTTQSGVMSVVIANAYFSNPGTGTATFYSGQNRGGTVVATSTAASNLGLLYLNDPLVLDADGFSMYVEMSSGAFNYTSPSSQGGEFIPGMEARYMATNGPGTYLQKVGYTLGDSSAYVAPSTVPEPGSLLLVALAGLGLVATSRGQRPVRHVS
jgi:hypothetical protein